MHNRKWCRYTWTLNIALSSKESLWLSYTFDSIDNESPCTSQNVNLISTPSVYQAGGAVLSLIQWRSRWGGKGGRVPPWQRKNCPKSGKIRKNREKFRKNRGKKRKNRDEKAKIGDVSFTLPLLTDRAGYAISLISRTAVECLYLAQLRWLLLQTKLYF